MTLMGRIVLLRIVQSSASRMEGKSKNASHERKESPYHVENPETAAPPMLFALPPDHYIVSPSVVSQCSLLRMRLEPIY